MEWYLEVFRKYATFRGRARRKEFWTFQTVNVVIVGVVISGMIHGDSVMAATLFMLGFFYGLFCILPQFAVTARRLHDIGKSGWYQVLLFVPLFNLLVFFYLCKPGKEGKNQYGVDPSLDYEIENTYSLYGYE